MKKISLLILTLSLDWVRCCKSKGHPPHQEVDVGNSTDGESGKLDSIPIEKRNFLACLFEKNDDYKQSPITAVRILPHVMLTGAKVRDSNRHRYCLCYIGDNPPYPGSEQVDSACSHFGGVSLKKVINVGGAHKNYAILVQTPSLEVINTYMDFVELPIRLDPSIGGFTDDCLMCYVSSEKKKVCHKQQIMQVLKDGIVITCPAEADYSFVETRSGAAVICNQRLRGLVLNEESGHIGLYKFGDMRPDDYWVLTKVHPHGSYDYNAIWKPTNKESHASASHRFSNVVISGIVIILCLLSYCK